MEEKRMDISSLTDQEKSVLLAKAMGLEISPNGTYFKHLPDWNQEYIWGNNFYDPANMALAWRSLNWADQQRALSDRLADYFIAYLLWIEPPADAQRLWLDKILELALEAGIVELENER